MRGTYGSHPDNGDNDTRDDAEAPSSLQPQQQQLVPSLQIPKNRSTGNLGSLNDPADKAGHSRFSFVADSSLHPALSPEYDPRLSSARSPIMNEHDHGLGMSGLRRIRQQLPLRTPTLPSSTLSRSPSLVNLATRSSSLSLTDLQQIPTAASVPVSPAFTEDLSRFPSESLHSFSFANQTDDLLHNRQTLLKRSLEFMKDRMGWSVSSAAVASAQARVSGDPEMQGMMDVLAQAQMFGSGNDIQGRSRLPMGPSTDPAITPNEGNVFDKGFAPRTASPESIDRIPLLASPATLPASGLSIVAPAPAQEKEGCEDMSDPPSLPTVHKISEEAIESEGSSRTPTNESGTTAQTSPPASRRESMLKRAMTDTVNLSMEQRLRDALAHPMTSEPLKAQQPVSAQLLSSASVSSKALAAPVPGHTTRWVPAAQAIFTTESKPPWTILAANDLACLLFGVTKAEVRKMGILEVIQEERRAWLVNKLQQGLQNDTKESPEEEPSPPTPAVDTSKLLGSRNGGITAKLLSKPNSRALKAKTDRRPATIHSGDPKPPRPGNPHHTSNKSRGVLLCGDVVPIQKRNGATGSASLWVKEKRVGLIWVMEEIHEDVAYIELDEEGIVTKLSGALGPIWGNEHPKSGMDVGQLIPRIPRQGIDPHSGEVDYMEIAKKKHYTCRNADDMHLPATVEQIRGTTQLRVSSFPHIAGMIVVDPETLHIKSSNSVFCGALFGHEKPDGKSINSLVPNFENLLRILTEEERIELVEGMVVPEHSFRKAYTLLAIKENHPDAAQLFMHCDGIPARHRDGSQLKVDVQMRVAKSEKKVSKRDQKDGDSDGESSTSEAGDEFVVSETEWVYALWVTYSRQVHSTRPDKGISSPLMSGMITPLHQPSPGQTQPVHSPQEIQFDSEEQPKSERAPLLAENATQIVGSTAQVPSTNPPAQENPEKQPGEEQQKEQQKEKRKEDKKEPDQQLQQQQTTPAAQQASEPPVKKKKTIDDFQILEEMGQGAYGQVKLARYRSTGKTCVLKYVTKKRILVDTWTRDRRLGTVPLEIHVLDFLRRDGFKHPNIVEMQDFFEDEINYYIEMVPHGLPGMDLFDYIELRTNMEERECRSIFVQVARAVHHLHTKALIVHRDIKDENVILDGTGQIKLIDFGSAAYIKSGPFDVFVGTIDYAAPEVLAGRPYRGKEQDVWALGILLYTIIYKENPFYNVDEIMDRDLRVPWTMSDESIDLIRKMLNRNVSQRLDIEGVLAHPWCQGVEMVAAQLS